MIKLRENLVESFLGDEYTGKGLKSYLRKNAIKKCLHYIMYGRDMGFSAILSLRNEEDSYFKEEFSIPINEKIHVLFPLCFLSLV